MSAEFATEDLVVVDNELIKKLKSSALKEKLGRYRFCLHKDHASPIQEMVIALGKSSYVQPHRHPDNRVESYCILEGELDVVIFNNMGEVEKILSLNEKNNKVLRIGASIWHMPIARSEWVVYHEVLQGPFDKEVVVEYAKWAPSQDSNKIKEFQDKIYV